MFRFVTPASFLLISLLSLLVYSQDISAQQYRIGFVPGDSPHGVKIQSITQGGPMTKLVSANGQVVFAEATDVIVSVNGIRTPNLQTFKSALANLGVTNGRASIGLLNHRNGVVEYYTLQATEVKSENQESSKRGQKPGISGVAVSYAGIGVTAAPGGFSHIRGMVIQSATSNSPLQRMSDSAGNQIKVDRDDMVVRIDGRATPSGQALQNAYQAAGQRFQVSLYDINTGQVKQFFATKNANAGNTPQTGRISVLIAGMIDEKIRSSVTVSTERMGAIVKDQIQSQNLGKAPVKLVGGNFGPNDITQQIRGFNACLLYTSDAADE